MANDYTENWIDEIPQQIELTQREKELRDRVVREYLIDFDYTAAAIRVGYANGVAIEYGQRFKYDPYVQQQIAKYMGAQPDDPEATQAALHHTVIKSLVREANYKGPGASHAARVSALSKLATIHGMEAPTQTVAKVTHEGGQNINVTHDFDFGTLTDDERAMVRRLLQGQVNADSTAAS